MAEGKKWLQWQLSEWKRNKKERRSHSLNSNVPYFPASGEPDTVYSRLWLCYCGWKSVGGNWWYQVFKIDLKYKTRKSENIAPHIVWQSDKERKLFQQCSQAHIFWIFYYFEKRVKARKLCFTQSSHKSMMVCHFCVFVCIYWVQVNKLTADSTPATALDNQAQVLPSNWVWMSMCECTVLSSRCS